MSKTNDLRYKISNWRIASRRVPILVIGAMFVVAATVPSAMVRADTFQDQINALTGQNSQTQDSLSSLQLQAANYHDAINKLQSQIYGVQAAIADNQARQADLQTQIVAAQTKLDQQRAGLSQDLKAMYIGGQMSTVEMLATSKSLNAYVDAQTYSNAIQNKIQSTLAEITKLQAALRAQQAQVQQLIISEQQERASLASDQNQQQRLLAMNQSQQVAYDQQIQANNTKIESLRAQQRAANLALNGRVSAGDPGHGGYPAKWDAPVAQDSLVDSWGLYNRECVSYTAWKVYQSYGTMPYWGGVGNANQWPGDARAAGIATGSVPRPGSVAIWMVGYYGHAMWVEAVNGNMVYVSQYNYDYSGHYSEMWVDGSRFTYIYFGG